MHPDIHLALHHARAAELRAEVRAHATGPIRPSTLRVRIGWTLIAVGLRLATTARPAAAAA
ncbi:hypothetical protein AB0K80_07475 [Streptomyces sp. NPDC052682]|uniref:hypothetical protein n=1 Tax=Streptomyces sp. NPDC052682 TaxID=3154954 RepID=UPI003415C605